MPLASLVCLLMALPVLGTVVHGEAWWVPAAVMATVAAGVSALYRLSGWDAFPIPFLQAFAVALLVTPLFASHIAPLGLLPSVDVVMHLLSLFEQGVDTIDSSSPPVAASSGTMLVIALLFAVFAMASDFLAVTARCPGMVGGLLLALMVVPLIVDDGGLGWLPAASCAVGFLLMLAVDMWVRGREWGMRVPDGPGPSARVLGVLSRGVTVSVAVAASVLLALTVPLAVPSLRTDAFYTMADGTYIGTSGDVITTTHPLVSLRRELASSSERTVLTYRTDAEQPGYLRTYVLDEFDGTNWTMAPVNASGDTRVVGELPLPAGWREAPSQAVVTTRISLDSDSPRMEFLPLPYWVRAVDVSGEWYADPRSLMVFTTERPSTGLSFTVESVEQELSAEELAGAGNSQPLLGDYRNLPRGLDPRVRELTDALTEGAGSPYERALAIQDYFTGGSFTYDLNPPSVPGDADPLAHFLLEDRVGYCEQFAGAMAVMARQAGIPARVAVGYTAGELMGDGRWTVSVGNAHAWPELYFEKAGWVRFEPTPSAADGQGSASVPEYALGEGDRSGQDGPPGEIRIPDTEEPEQLEEDEAPSEGPSRSPQESQAPEDELGDAGTGAGTGSGAGSDLSWPPTTGIVAGGLLLALPALIRVLVRWSRMAVLSGSALRPAARKELAVDTSATGAPATGAHTAWRELRDTCLDLGGSWVLTESPRAAAERLTRSGPLSESSEPLPEPPGLMSVPTRKPVSEEAAAALRRLALAEESARYAPSPTASEGLCEDLRAAIAGLSETVGGGARVRAVLLPRSLAPWHRPRPASYPAATVPRTGFVR